MRQLMFCIPPNKELVSYWDRVEDRLFKIRHCMDIQGQGRQLPLFEPPIDPALLVRAQAAGLSIGAVLQDISAVAKLPLLGDAAEGRSGRRGENLGAALLSASARAEADLALGAGAALARIRDVLSQIAGKRRRVSPLQKPGDGPGPKDHYQSREFVSGGEQERSASQRDLWSLEASAELRAVALSWRHLAR
jgi:hypothetical protein